ncbi:hypothetical protein FHS95_000605 [Sphingomonas naasensis]|uniref:Uncharacterized protein n=1 Tax=Sphingomonas naasensis TaxID=1344951 RepID=A0A4V3QXE3_9SPHN|nr:hypothetical protein [Sphingomonas naasensis]NIJ18936.1 hypothetical protein [Sphingomonas naasensis]TGX46152.1 hypothetical protein E5A74_03025 [Sphingomonas naasensis]
MSLLIAAALVAQAADPLCPQIARLIAAAREKAPFASLRAEGFELRLLERHPCSADGRGYHCKRVLLPPEVTAGSVAQQIAACLPDAKISVEKTGDWAREKTVVRGSGLAFALDESGDDRAHVGRILFVLVRPGSASADQL